MFFDRYPREDKQKGYVLVLVLWFSALVSIGLAYTAETFQFYLESGIRKSDGLERRLWEYSNKETVLYLLATRERSFKGLDLDRKVSRAVLIDPTDTSSFRNATVGLEFDDRWYHALGPCQLSVQDSASLVSLRDKTLIVGAN